MTPRNAWGRTWAVTVVLTVCALGGWEGLLRTRGFEPGATDGFALWSRTRTRASNDDARTFALVGTSVIQASIALDAFERAVPGSQPLQLALSGSSPVPVIEDLARDEHFRGIVVVEYSGPMLADRGDMERLPALHLDHYRTSTASPFERVEAEFDQLLDARFAFRQNAVSPRQLLLAWRRGAWPVPGTVRVTQGRELVIHDHADPRDGLRRTRNANRALLGRGPLDAAGLRAVDANIARLARSVEMLRQRGANAAFVFLRCEGPGREITEWRRLEHWDTLRGELPGVYLDVADLLEPASLACPDGAHLYARDREKLTLALASALVASFPERSGDQR